MEKALTFGDVQETALIPLAIKASETARKNARIRDEKAKTIFGWGTKSGEEYIPLEPRMELVSERSYNEEMKKYTIRGKLFALIAKNINNRLAVFKW